MTAVLGLDFSAGYAAGHDDAMTRCRTILDAGQRLEVLGMAVALLDADLEPEVAIRLMEKASPVPPGKRGAVADAPN